jgi:hypothetical protein
MAKKKDEEVRGRRVGKTRESEHRTASELEKVRWAREGRVEKRKLSGEEK